MARRLPIGIQDFPKIREGSFVYVDKTARIHELISGSTTACFLSRSRHFGKSLLCSTLGAIFEGRRELFGEIAGQPALAIASLDWEWKKHPVIYIDLNPGNYSNPRGLSNCLPPSIGAWNYARKSMTYLFQVKRSATGLPV